MPDLSNIRCRGCLNTGIDFMGRPCGCDLGPPATCIMCQEQLTKEGNCITCDADPDNQLPRKVR